ncbi:MAG TPA: hypothetical protein DCY94_00430 [Firmicutes bacterium]|nr:hypothetical protein [Bacillota bacterium]
MKKITIIWTVVLVLLVGGMTIFGLYYKSHNVDHIMEKALVKQAEKYMGLYPGLFPQKGKTFKLDVDKLKEEGYDAELEKDCDGYVIISNENMGFKYKAYIKCPNYTTEGYEGVNNNNPISKESLS